MQIIRDEQLGGLAMIPLFADWRIRRCNIKGCTEIPTTIVTGAVEGCPPFGMCEEHYQSAIKDGSLDVTLVFDDFDAFAKAKAEAQ